MPVNYTERKAVGGSILGEIKVGRKKVVISIQDSPGVRLCIGDPVVWNWLATYIPKGVRGQVTRISEPYVGGYTSNVILVVWENGYVARMKFEELFLEHLALLTNAGVNLALLPP